MVFELFYRNFLVHKTQVDVIRPKGVSSEKSPVALPALPDHLRVARTPAKSET